MPERFPATDLLLGRTVFDVLDELELAAVGERWPAVDFAPVLGIGFETGFLVVFIFGGRFVAVFEAGADFGFESSEGDDGFPGTSFATFRSEFSLAESFCPIIRSAASLEEVTIFATCSTTLGEISGRSPCGEDPKLLPALASSDEPTLWTPQLVVLCRGRSAAAKVVAVGEWAAFSTAMKLARTFDNGRPEPELSEFTGDRPRDGGEVALFWLLSNLARRLRTLEPLLISCMMDATVSRDKGYGEREGYQGGL